jgi:hypothetical protein
VLAHRNNRAQGKHVAPLAHIINQFLLLLRNNLFLAANTNFLVFDLNK